MGWSLSLADPGSAGVMWTVAPPLQLMAVVPHGGGPFKKKKKNKNRKRKHKQPNNVMNRCRIDVGWDQEEYVCGFVLQSLQIHTSTNEALHADDVSPKSRII